MMVLSVSNKNSDQEILEMMRKIFSLISIESLNDENWTRYCELVDWVEKQGGSSNKSMGGV